MTVMFKNTKQMTLSKPA